MKSSISATQRPLVWKIMLNVLPNYRENWEFINTQNKEEFEDLQNIRNLLAPQQVDNNSNISNEKKNQYLLVATYKLANYLANQTEGILVNKEKKANKKLNKNKNILDMAGVIANVFNDNLVDGYFCLKNLLKLRNYTYFNEEEIIEELIYKLENLVKNKLKKLLDHFIKHEIKLHNFAMNWFSNYFASSLPITFLKSLWDKIIAVGDFLLPFYALIFLQKLSPQLLAINDPKKIKHILSNVTTFSNFFLLNFIKIFSFRDPIGCVF